MPSHVTLRNRILASSSPGVLKTWMTKVKRMIHQSGFKERSIMRMGTFERTIRVTVSTVTMAYEMALLQRKIRMR